MDAARLEANPEETEAAVERQVILENEEINAENIGSSEDRSGNRRLVVRGRRRAKKWAQESVGSRQKSSAARKRVMRRAIPAVRKGNIPKLPGRKSVGRVHPKSRTFGNKQRLRSEYNKRINYRDPKNQLRQMMRRTSGRSFRKPMQLDMARLIFGSITAVKNIIYWTQEDCADSIGTGTLKGRPLKKTNKNGLVHGDGPHLIKEPLETNGLMERAAGTAGDQPVFMSDSS
jgi:hypothetical protein